MHLVDRDVVSISLAFGFPSGCPWTGVVDSFVSFYENTKLEGSINLFIVHFLFILF